MDQMTPQAKAAIMQLMGQTYGQLKKQDDMLVGSSGNLRPKSAEMKGMVENLVRTPTAPPPGYMPPQQPAPQPVPEPVPVAPTPVTPEQAIAELQQAPQLEINAFAPVPEAPVEEQGMFDFSEPSKIDQLIDLQKQTNLLLKEIKVQLESSDVRSKRKSAKAKVAD